MTPLPNFSLGDDIFLRAAEQFPTPFYLYEERGIRHRPREAFRRPFHGTPRYREYFAVKALPNPSILKILIEEGCGLDCSSMTELVIAKRLGLKGEDLMFSANAMPPEEFRMAREMGAIINLDDISDIDILLHHGGSPESICLRYNPRRPVRRRQHHHGQPPGQQPGWTRPQLGLGLARLKELGVKRFGLHAFLASNMLGEVYYPLLAKLLYETGKELTEECGLPLDFINLSGGIGIPYRPDDQPADLELIGKRVEEDFHGSFRYGCRGCCRQNRAGPLYDRPLRLAGSPRRARKHAQAIHRPGCLRCQPDAPGHVRGLSPHHHRGQKGKRPSPRYTM